MSTLIIIKLTFCQATRKTFILVSAQKLSKDDPVLYFDGGSLRKTIQYIAFVQGKQNIKLMNFA